MLGFAPRCLGNESPFFPMTPSWLIGRWFVLRSWVAFGSKSMADPGRSTNLADLGKGMLVRFPRPARAEPPASHREAHRSPARQLYPGDARLRGSRLVFGLRDLI